MHPGRLPARASCSCPHACTCSITVLHMPVLHCMRALASKRGFLIRPADRQVQLSFANASNFPRLLTSNTSVTSGREDYSPSFSCSQLALGCVQLSADQQHLAHFQASYLAKDQYSTVPLRQPVLMLYSLQPRQNPLQKHAVL